MDSSSGERYRYCPRCGSEYRAGFRICADCGVELVDRLPDDQPDPIGDPDYEAITSWVGTDPVEVFRGSEVDAALVRGALVDADIPAAVWSAGHGGYLGHSGLHALFPSRVMVHKDDEAEARALVAGFDAGPGR
ncbi:MAG TPA: DUF2007 domain-containing protein [Actinomycetota bacterium]|nr:DUF2007 domain-containing protein [Actinomycetota bacterium]